MADLPSTPSDTTPLLGHSKAEPDPASQLNQKAMYRLKAKDAVSDRCRLPSGWHKFSLYLAIVTDVTFLSISAFCISSSHALTLQEYSYYHIITGVLRCALYLFVGRSMASAAGADTQCCCNPYYFAPDTIWLSGLMCFFLFGAMQVEHAVKGHDVSPELALEHVPELLSIVSYGCVIASENCMFRLVSLYYDFSYFEYMTFKGIAICNILAILIFGVIAASAPDHNAVTTLYIFGLILWRKDQYSCLCVLDSSNKFVGIPKGYTLLNSVGFYDKTSFLDLEDGHLEAGEYHAAVLKPKG